MKGLYKFKSAPEKKKLRAHIFGSGPIINSALKAQEILAERYGVAADVWSATSYKLLRTDAIRCQRWNMLHPTESPRKSYVESSLAKEKGVIGYPGDGANLWPAVHARDLASLFRLALEKVYTEKKHVTRDVGGTAGTSEFAGAVIEALHAIPPPQAELQEVQT